MPHRYDAASCAPHSPASELEHVLLGMNNADAAQPTVVRMSRAPLCPGFHLRVATTNDVVIDMEMFVTTPMPDSPSLPEFGVGG
ncbi:MAG: hypothetical protein JWQ20_1912 [Conexibacter sp.]|nr:hypothetical protein [Conexibacter sp.]